MATFKLKNGLMDSGVVPGIGRYVDGVLKNAPEDFENPNFERVEEQVAPAPAPNAPVAPAVSAPTPATPAPVQPTQTQETK